MIEKIKKEIQRQLQESEERLSHINARGFVAPNEEQLIVHLKGLLSFIDTLEVKEVDEQKEMISECPYRQVGCAMYEGKILECKGACSWVVDHLKLKELKAQKGE